MPRSMGGCNSKRQSKLIKLKITNPGLLDTSELSPPQLDGDMSEVSQGYR